MPTVNCKFCGKSTQKKPYKLKSRGHLFCSKLCADTYRRIDPNRTHKVCSTCGIKKPRSEYNVKTKSPDGLYCYCKSCVSKRGLDFRNRNIEKLKDSRKARYKNNKPVFKAWGIKHKYGITMDQVESLRSQQNGLCAICKSEPAVQIDHNHVTDQVRGLLCGKCNAGLGMFREDTSILSSAIQYIKRWKI